jgi:hypothetical protein
MSNWETKLRERIQENEIQLLEPMKLFGGTKYIISPSVEFEDLRGSGSPVSSTRDKGNILDKGWICPVNQDIFKTLKRYICDKVNIPYEDNYISMNLYNQVDYSHKDSSCYDTCSAKNKSGVESLCLRTWVFNDIHKTDGKLNTDVFRKPWYDMTDYNNLRLTNVSGRITAVYIPKESSYRLKFWCKTKYGEVVPKMSFKNDKFEDSEFQRLLEEEGKK